MSDQISKQDRVVVALDRLAKLEAAASALRDELKICAAELLPKPTFKLFKKVKIGTGLRSEKDFKEACRVQKVQNLVGFQHIKIAEREKELELTIVSVSELGDDICCMSHFFGLALRAGLRLCPREVALQLLLQCTDDIPAGGLCVASNPVVRERLNLFPRKNKEPECQDWYLHLRKPTKGNKKRELGIIDLQVDYGYVLQPELQFAFLLPPAILPASD